MSDSMITCREAVEQLWAYIDGELDQSHSLSVADHLGACKGCNPQFDFQKAFLEFVQQQSDKAIPADLRRRVFLRLLAEDRRDTAGRED